jgi:hypothetical protein
VLCRRAKAAAGKFAEGEKKEPLQLLATALFGQKLKLLTVNY